ncbi:tRNA (guanine(37)-N1)-methyltransferase [Homalodisca vitripennis]|nr:tRNA (guanine(37)-N1)-methyltransferase [Homalodisca vitripennis]
MVTLAPPLAVRGMKKLDRDRFAQTIDIPCLRVKSSSVGTLTGLLKRYLLKMRSFKAIRPVCSENGVVEDIREVVLDPRIITSFGDFTVQDRELLGQMGIDESSFKQGQLDLTYDNWAADDVLAAVLPEGVETAAGYSLIGHIVHVNLREHLHEYKHVIGEVLLDKIKQARTVVNKVDTIDSTFRVFNMEVLAGEPDFVTEVKENSLRFKFDFSAVYWNSRLGTEHERIVKKLSSGDVLYDVFAGVGPFSIPAAKKKCFVLANDLNPESYKWLQKNAKLNKVEEFITAFNKDGADFIKEEVKNHILEHRGEQRSHIVMNLPAIAVSFLPAFKYLFSMDQLKQIRMLPLIHVYCFVKGEGNSKEMATSLVEDQLNCSISEAVSEVFFVRNVAPNKDMMRVSFHLTESMVLGGKRPLELETGVKDKEVKKTK